MKNESLSHTQKSVIGILKELKRSERTDLSKYLQF